MLKKQLRISRKDLNLIFRRKGVFGRGNVVSLKIVRNQKNASCAAFAVSSDKKKTATLRNTARRRMGEIIRQEYGRIKQGYDMVFLLKIRDKNTPSFGALKDDMIDLLKKAEIYV